jgi:hypothetical protein
MEFRETQRMQSDEIAVSRTKREDRQEDTITLAQAVVDLAYKGPGGNGEVEKRLRAGHTLENADYIYRVRIMRQTLAGA